MSEQEIKIALARLETKMDGLRETIENQKHDPRISSLEHSRTKFKAVIGTAWAGIAGLGWLWWRSFG